jgi:hypothetical protein
MVATSFGLDAEDRDVPSAARRWRRPPAVRLARGEWVRWQVNYRFSNSWEGGWTYSLETLNVVHGPAGSRELFLGEPTYQVSELASLR